MKSVFLTIILIPLFFSGFSQEVGFSMFSTQGKAISKDKLNDAQTIKDLNAGFPASWIKDHDYISVDIVSLYDGQKTKTTGLNNKLTSEQIDLLKSAKSGGNIQVIVLYNAMNSVTKAPEVKEVNFKLSVLPAKQAEFFGGEEELQQYFTQQTINSIDLTEPVQATIRFTVNADGSISNVQLTESTEHNRIDKLILDSVANMPKWKSAQNAEGVSITQDFEYRLGNIIGC